MFFFQGVEKLPTLAIAKKDTDALMKTIQEKLPTVQSMKKTVGAEAAAVQIVADDSTVGSRITYPYFFAVRPP